MLTTRCIVMPCYVTSQVAAGAAYLVLCGVACWCSVVQAF
jgi:hypothetical protein